MTGHTPDETGRRERLLCVCTGAPDAPPWNCPAEATQEDFLCDHCRTLQCATRTNEELAQLWCVNLGCPEHSVPGSKPIEPAWEAS